MATAVYRPFLYLWEHRTLFIGKLDAPIDVSTGAPSLMLGLDKPIRYTTSEMQASIECRSLIIPAGTDVVIDTQGAIIASCILEPLGKDFHVLSKLTCNQASNTGYNLKNEQVLIDAFLEISCSPIDTAAISHLLFQLLNSPATDEQENNTLHEIDPRIEHVITLIQKTASLNLSLSEIAEQANLSPSRLTELFKKQTGLPLRRYRLWYRLYLTALKVGQKKTLTEAAFEAGFNDSPHFNRTFKSMLGISPSCILSQTLKVIIPDNMNDKLDRKIPELKKIPATSR